MRPLQLIVFKLGDEVVGIDMQAVLGIKSYKDATKIPDTPEYIEGIISLRGDIIVTVNLKKKFNLENPEIVENSRIIEVNSEEIQIGFIVDEVSSAKVPCIHTSEQTSDIIRKVNVKYIKEIREYKGRSIMILDLESVLIEIEL